MDEATSYDDSNTTSSRIPHRNNTTSLSRASRRNDDKVASSSRTSRHDERIALSSRPSHRDEKIASSSRPSHRDERIASSSRPSHRDERIASSSRTPLRDDYFALSTSHRDDVIASASRVSRRNDDVEEEFNALLLRLSQAHTNQVKELKLKLDFLQRKYNKLKSCTEENYTMTRTSWNEAKILKEENKRLRRRLAILERRNAEKSRDSNGEEEQDGSQSTNQVQDVSDDDTAKPAKVNKLSKTRSSKRVRYSEVDPSQEQTLQRDENVHKNKRSRKDKSRELSSHDADDAEVIDDDQETSAKNTVLMHDLIEQNSIDQRLAIPAKILAPETCHPSGEMEYSDDLDNDLYAGGDNRRKVLAVPETLAVQGNFEDSEFMNESGFDPPTCASTPRNVSQSSRISDIRCDEDADQNHDSLMSIRHDGRDDYEHQNGREIDNDETCFVSQDHRKQSIARSKSQNPEFDNDETRFESQTHQKHLQSRSKRQYPVVDNDETRFVSQDHQRRSHSRSELQHPVADNDETRFVSQDHRRRSLPRSESQYPVDLLSTQVPSPTFCGGNDDDDNDDDDDEVKVVLDIEMASTSHEISTNSKTPQSVYANDASYQLEASLLLLQRPQEMMTPPTPAAAQEKDAPIDLTSKRLERTARSTSAWKPNPRKRKNLLDESFDYELNDKEGDAASMRRYQEQLSGRFDDESIEPLDIDAHVPDKENSPPSADPCTPQKAPSSSRHQKPSNEDMDTHGKLIITKLSPKRSSNKVLKQSKLSSAMFQTSRTDNASLIAQYNGVGRANLDSQRDESLAKAIELSILENMDSLKNSQDKRRICKKDGDFKIPSLPNLRKSPKKRGDKDKLKDSVCAGMLERLRDESSMPGKSNRHKTAGLSEDVVFDVIDDNDRGGTVSKLSRKKRRTACDQEKSEQTAREDRASSDGVKNGEKAVMEEVHDISDAGDDGNNSCADLFEDDAGGDVADDIAMVMDEDAHEEEGDLSGGGMEERNANQSLGMRYAQDFDRIPSKSPGPAYKYVDIVRKKEERQRLKAFDCKECEAFYKDMKLTDEERQERMRNCSRHRAHFSPPSTPEHYWSIDFPDTPTCLQRGYMQVSESTQKPSRRRGPNKYKQLF